MKRKPERGLKALAAGSLAVTRIHNILDITEKKLEQEIERENRAPPKTTIGRARRKGEKVIHSKHVLFCVVMLNIIDCILVLGELILDMYYIKALLESSENLKSSFIIDMKNIYPTHLGYVDTDIKPLYLDILASQIEWANSTHNIEAPFVSSNNTIKTSLHHSILRRAAIQTNSSDYQHNIDISVYQDIHDIHPIEEVLAHAFHKASIAILSILAAETLFKIFAYGKSFIERKLEVFDCIIIFCSLFVDLYFLKGISAYSVQEFVIILAFLVPWRVIRVVNSLVVAVIDHEHFRLKLLYKQKKGISNELKKSKSEIKNLQKCLDVMKAFAVNEGIPQQKIEQHLEEQKQAGEGELTTSECLEALKIMKNNKSPGLDGYTSEFYKFLKPFLLKSLNYSFEKGFLSISQRQGVITCIPKEGKSKFYLKNWRPITLLNVDMKIASAALQIE